MTPRQRRWLLSAHLLAIGAWLGSVLCILVLNVVAIDAGGGAHAARVAAEVVDVRLIRPTAVASLVTGVLLSVLGPWGLTRH